MSSTDLKQKSSCSSKGFKNNENFSVTNDSKENKEDITIIYFNITVNRKTTRRINMLREINNYVIMHTDIDECVVRTQTIKKEKIIFVTTGKNVANILPRIEKIRQIDGIFIFSAKLNKYDQFKEKIAGIFNDNNDMIVAIRKHIETIYKQLQALSFYRHYQRYIRNLTDMSATFLWFHVFKDVVMKLSHDENAKKEMLDVSRNYYRDNVQELRRIDEFEQRYRSVDAIRWYTKNSFIYRLLNKALRTEDVEQMYAFRYFIQDLCSALTIKHKTFLDYGEPVTVYRGLRLTKFEFDELVKDEQQLISMNGYLSTSLTQRIAEIYAGKPTPTSDKLSVLLEIECDVAKLGDSVIFADIGSESNFPDENEVLFDIGATFQMTASPKRDDNGVWHLKIAVSDEGRSLVRKYIDDHLEWNTDMSPTIMFGVLLYGIGKYNSSLSYFNKLLASPNGEDIALIHAHIARALNLRGDKHNEWNHYDKAYKILVEAEPKRLEDEARVLIHMGVFCSDRNENDRAIEYLTAALHRFEQIYGNTNPEVARALLCIGTCYEQKGDYYQTIEYYQRALKIHDDNKDRNHLIQCQVLIALGNTYRVQYKYEDALISFQRALDIRTRTLPEKHSDIADCLMFIGKTLGDMDEQAAAVLYSMRALQMYCQTLPESELNEKSSVLVDIGIAFSSVDAFQLGIEYFNRALGMKKKCLPRSHPDYAAVYENLAVNYSYLNKHLLGLRYALKARRLRKRIQASNHPHMVGTLKVLATVYSNMGSYMRAKHYLIKARNVLTTTAPDDCPEWTDLKRQIARLKKKIQNRRPNNRKRKFWSLKKATRLHYLKLLSIMAKINLKFCPSL